jgi:uncharacterized protein (TIGR02246 family)
MKRGMFVFGILATVAAVSTGQDASPPSSAETAIRQGVAAYVKAFNAQDAKALADQWSPDAVYVNRSTGEEVTGRKAIVEQFDALFKVQKDLKLDISIESIRFLSPNVAVEQGTAKFLKPQTEPEEIEYTAVYVQRDGKWLLDRVTDQEKETVTSHYEHLKSLEWMVGQWVDQDDSTRIETDCHWAKNQNFLVRSFTIAVNGQIDIYGMQIIGWDASTKSIRSWTFDSAGGFAEGAWKQKGNKWFISNKGVLTDGRSATMVNVIKLVDDNTFTWQTIERTVAGELLPNIPEVQIVRQ